MSSINFEDVANFSNTSLFSISKEELQTQCQKNRHDLELLPKLNAAKAIVQGTPSSVIPPDMDLTKVQEILEIGQEELQFKTFAQQKDIYNTNILEKTNKIISDIHISQTNILSTTLEAIGTYVNVLNEFSNQVSHPIGPEKFTAAINEDAIINTKIIKYTEYMDKVVTFRNRMGYILSFMTPKALNSNVDIKTFVEGMPYANTITYEEGNEALFMQPIALNTNSKLSLSDWDASKLSNSYNKYIDKDIQLCEVLNRSINNMIKVSAMKNKTATISASPIFVSMANLIGDYIYTQEAFLSMLYNLLK